MSLMKSKIIQSLGASNATTDGTAALLDYVARLEAENKRIQGELTGLKREHAERLTALEARIKVLEEKLALARSKRFARQSETLKVLQGQLFDEAELEVEIQALEAELDRAAAEADAARAKRDGHKTSQPASKTTDKPKRTSLPSALRRVEIEVELTPEQAALVASGRYEQAGYEITEHLARQSAECYVKCHKRPRFVLREDPADRKSPMAPDAELPAIFVAPPPPVLLPKAIADASLLSHAIVGKFVDGMSYLRCVKALERDGIHIKHSTLCDWTLQAAERLQPIYGLLHEELAASRRWHLDETTLQVLGEPNRQNATKSYLWVIRAGPPDQPVLLFHYDSRRSFAALDAWLSPYMGDFQGVIVTDEHAPYNRFSQTYSGIRAHGGCWAHCRRKFADAAKGRRSGSDPARVLQQIAVLYRLETSLDDLNGERLVQARQEIVKPQTEAIRATLDHLCSQYPKKGLMRDAIGYALNNWHKLTAFLDHADLPLDNNPAEAAIRPFTIGRKNWIFAGSPRGAASSAFWYSLVETAKANGWEPRAYLNELFERFPLARTRDEQRALLPMFLKTSTSAGLGQ